MFAIFLGRLAFKLAREKSSTRPWDRVGPGVGLLQALAILAIYTMATAEAAGPPPTAFASVFLRPQLEDGGPALPPDQTGLLFGDETNRDELVAMGAAVRASTYCATLRALHARYPVGTGDDFLPDEQPSYDKFAREMDITPGSGSVWKPMHVQFLLKQAAWAVTPRDPARDCRAAARAEADSAGAATCPGLPA